MVAQYVPDSQTCWGYLTRVKLMFSRWGQALWQENELVSQFNCHAWANPDGASQRGIVFLSKVITLLLICCLAAPSTYMCPETAEVGDDEGDDIAGEMPGWDQTHPDTDQASPRH